MVCVVHGGVGEMRMCKLKIFEVDGEEINKMDQISWYHPIDVVFFSL